MTAREVLEEILRAGGRIVPDPEHPRRLIPPQLKPLVTEHREALRRLVLDTTSEQSERMPYAFPWPDELPGLGARRVGTFVLCADCAKRPQEARVRIVGAQEFVYKASIGTWVHYRDTPLCLACARTRACRSGGPAERPEPSRDDSA
jgi:hypothetical protein